MTENIGEDFESRVRNSGVKLKNVPNVEVEDAVFTFTDYVAKDPSTWAYVPDDLDDVDVEEYAEEMYEIYESLEEHYDEVTVGRSEDDMYWAEISVDVPEDKNRRERLANDVAESILARQQL
jgi:hypothetical protein